MKKLLLFPALLTALSFGTPLMATTTCTSLPSNLVANCGFETGDLSGWTATPPGYEGQYYGVDTVDADTGTYGAYLAGQNSDVYLSQDVATSAGTTYYLNFSVAHPDVNYAPYSNDFSVLAGSDLLYSESDGVFGFTSYSVGFTATGSSTTIAFGAFDPLGFFSLDDVSVYIAPEPSSIAFCLPFLFVGGLFLVRRKRLPVQ